MFSKNLTAKVAFLLSAILACCYAQSDYQWEGLNSHNRLRQRHNSPAIRLDPSMNRAAQDCAVYYARKRNIDHSCKTPGAGENLYMMGGLKNPNLRDVVKSAVNAFYSEEKNYNYENPGSSRGVTGHFTQLVWKRSTTLGIGAVTIDGITVVVGKYKEHGNVGGGGYGGWQYYKENVQRPR